MKPRGIKFLLLFLTVTCFLETAAFKIDGWTFRLVFVPILLLFVVAVYRLVRRPSRKFFELKTIRVLILFAASGLISAVLSPFVLHSIKETLLVWLFVLSTVSVYITLVGRPHLVSFMVKGMLVVGLLASIYVVASSTLYTIYGIRWLGAQTDYTQSFSADIPDEAVTRAYGFFSMATTGGATIGALGVLALSELILEKRKPSPAFLALVSVFFLGAFLTYTRGYVIGVFAGLAFTLVAYWWIYNKNLLFSRRTIGSIILTAVAMFAVVRYLVPGNLTSALLTKFAVMFDTGSGSGLYRILRWESMWHVFISHPLFGEGLEYYKLVYQNSGNAENFLMDILSGMGLMGMVLFGFFHLKVFRRIVRIHFMRAIPKSKQIQVYSLASCYVSLFFGYITNPGYWTVFPWIVIGLLLASLWNLRLQRPAQRASTLPPEGGHRSSLETLAR